MEKYDRLKGVSPPCYLLMQVTCFGEMGGPYYSDKIIGSAKTEEDILKYCSYRDIPLNVAGGWNEYFIKKVEQ
jgi:hypothetical protein